MADTEVISVGAKGLIMTSYMYFFLGLKYVFRGLLNDVGDVTFSMMNGVFEIISRLLFINLMELIPAAGVWGVWYTNGLTGGVVGTMSVLRFVYGSWKKKI